MLAVVHQTALTDKDFRDFFLKSPVARMVVAVEEGERCVFVDVNQAASAHFEMLREEMLGRTPAELFEAALVEQLDKYFSLCIKTKKMVTFNVTRSMAGGVRVQSFILNPMADASGNVCYIDAMARPDTGDSAQLQRERDDALMLMTSLFDASGLGIVVTDHHGRIVRINDSFLNEYGWGREDLVGEEFLRLLPPEDHLFSKKLHAAFINRGRHGVREIQLLRKDGSVTDVVLTIALMELSQKRRFMVATVRDVTERKNMMRHLKRAKEEADIANRAKSSFLANMSHELRTPLNAIIGFSELMKNQIFGPLSNPKYEEYMTDIHFSSRHLLDIINDVLDMSKIEAGKIELVESQVSITEVLESVMRIMGDRARAASINLVFQVEEGIPHLKADQRLLRQILINLLSNAVKFSPAGKDVNVKAFTFPDRRVRILIEDQGCGIPADKIKTVQEPFGQVNDPRNYRGQGTGLGLPLAKAMMELHGGKLLLASEEGIGTQVSLDFPLERVMNITE